MGRYNRGSTLTEYETEYETTAGRYCSVSLSGESEVHLLPGPILFPFRVFHSVKFKGWQRTRDSIGVAGVYERR